LISTLDGEWNGLDAVFNIAGIVLDTNTDIRAVPFASWQRVIDVNLTGPFIVSRAAARAMVPRGHGTIVLVGSQGGVSMPASSFPYGASKGGVNGLAMTLDSSLGGTGVRIVNVIPASIDTPLLRSVVEAVDGSMEDSLASAHAASGLGESLALLAGEASAYIRGPMVTL
jgi:NAD(P)-dependent dehydrogenase (short-subunit alcohol dehydrogenase family)